jgi:hypothetical protein
MSCADGWYMPTSAFAISTCPTRRVLQRRCASGVSRADRLRRSRRAVMTELSGRVTESVRKRQADDPGIHDAPSWIEQSVEAADAHSQLVPSGRGPIRWTFP